MEEQRMRTAVMEKKKEGPTSTCQEENLLGRHGSEQDT